MNITPIKATTLTPFNYGHIAVQEGVATIPELISDQALAFALCSALGMMRASVVLPDKDYRSHLAAMPWRTAVLETEEPRLLPPLARRSDLGVEGGYPDRIRRATFSGNFKEYFTIQEVPPHQVFRGAVFGMDPFAAAGRSVKEVVVRIGSNRTGMLKLERDDGIGRPVRLNAVTAGLFGRKLPVERYALHGIQLTPEMDLKDAVKEVEAWI